MYHVLVSRFAVKDNQSLHDMRDDDVHHATIMVEIRYSLATLNANNFVVYGQNIKCG